MPIQKPDYINPAIDAALANQALELTKAQQRRLNKLKEQNELPDDTGHGAMQLILAGMTPEQYESFIDAVHTANPKFWSAFLLTPVPSKLYDETKANGKLDSFIAAMNKKLKADRDLSFNYLEKLGQKFRASRDIEQVYNILENSRVPNSANPAPTQRNTVFSRKKTPVYIGISIHKLNDQARIDYVDANPPKGFFASAWESFVRAIMPKSVANRWYPGNAKFAEKLRGYKAPARILEEAQPVNPIVESVVDNNDNDPANRHQLVASDTDVIAQVPAPSGPNDFVEELDRENNEADRPANNSVVGLGLDDSVVGLGGNDDSIIGLPAEQPAGKLLADLDNSVVGLGLDDSIVGLGSNDDSIIGLPAEQPADELLADLDNSVIGLGQEDSIVGLGGGDAETSVTGLTEQDLREAKETQGTTYTFTMSFQRDTSKQPEQHPRIVEISDAESETDENSPPKNNAILAALKATPSKGNGTYAKLAKGNHSPAAFRSPPNSKIITNCAQEAGSPLREGKRLFGTPRVG